MSDDFTVSVIDAEDTPWGFQVVDLRSIHEGGALSVTRDPAIAEHFTVSRTATGEEYRGQEPQAPVSVRCVLSYPRQRRDLSEGALFKAEVMEDKWDIYLFENVLCFVRSWTGQLAFTAAVEITTKELVITGIQAAPNALPADYPEFAILQVDYLVKSHILGWEVPHPLPPDVESLSKIVAYSVSNYGRRARFAARADTTVVQPWKDLHSRP